MIPPLRPHQVFGIDRTKQSLILGKRRPLLQMPTGGGKTLTAAWIIQSALDKGKRVIFGHWVMPHVSAWIRSRQIAFAKARQQEQRAA